MPRCIFHISLELTKLDLKIVQLRNMEQDQVEKEELAMDPKCKDEEEGSLGRRLEGGGLTYTNKGSLFP